MLAGFVILLIGGCTSLLKVESSDNKSKKLFETDLQDSSLARTNEPHSSKETSTLNSFFSFFNSGRNPADTGSSYYRMGFAIAKDFEQGLTINQIFPINQANNNDSSPIEQTKKLIVSIWGNRETFSIKGKTFSAQKLAELTVKTAEAIGIDYTVIATILKKESTYCLQRSVPGGNSFGCTHVTRTAINEINKQLNLPNSSAQNLHKRLTDFFQKTIPDNPNAKSDYLEWLKSDVNRVSSSLREGNNLEYDFITGALILKIYIALQEGDLHRGLMFYKGARLNSAYSKNADGNYLISSKFESFYKDCCKISVDPQKCEEQAFNIQQPPQK